MSDGWVITGTIAQVLSLIAVAVAVYELVARSRRVAVALVAHCHAVHLADDGKLYFIIDIVNAGGELALLKQLQVVNGTIAQHPDYPVEPSLPAGGRTRVWIEAEDEEKVWFRFEWLQPIDHRFVYVGWRPLLNGDDTELSRSWDVAMEKRPRRFWIRRFILDRWPLPVDPEHTVFGRMKANTDPETYARRLQRLMPTPPADPVGVWKFGLMDPRAIAATLRAAAAVPDAAARPPGAAAAPGGDAPS